MIKTKFSVYMAVLLLGTFISCNAQSDKANAEKRNIENDLVEITQLIETDVWLYDTTKQGTSECLHHLPMDAFPNKFLSYKRFSLFTDQLKHTFNDPNALIYSDPESGSPTSINERKRLIIKCDSIESMSSRFKGKTYANKALNYESANFWKTIDIITFYESWYYNKVTGEIVKQQLGYTVAKVDHDKEAVRVWYYYFNSKESRAKILKNW